MRTDKVRSDMSFKKTEFYKDFLSKESRAGTAMMLFIMLLVGTGSTIMASGRLTLGFIIGSIGLGLSLICSR